MTQKLFDIGKGALLGGRVSSAPGLSDDTLNARPGSLYLDDLDGGSYRKVRTAAGTDKWELIGAGLSPKVVSGVQGLAVVDQSYAAESAVVKWLVDVTRTNDPASRYLTEITALHDGSANADATRVDWNDYGVLHFGPAIDGLAIGVRLNGSGSAQVVELTVAAEVAVDVVVRRADLGLYLGAAEPLDISAAPHAATHTAGGTDPLAIDAAQVVSGTFSVERVPVAGSVPWDGVTGKPTTLAGYGITDAQLYNANIQTHIANAGNPHNTTAEQVGAAPASHTHPEYVGGGSPTALFPATLPAQFTDSQGRVWLASGNTVPVSQAPVADAAVWGLAVSDLLFEQQVSGFGTSSVRGVACGNGLFVAVGDSGALATSPDGVTWTQRTSGFGSSNILGVTYGNGLFVAIGESGALATSPDGVTWTQRTSSFGSSNILGVTYGNGLFVAVGDSGKLATSPDGVTWTQRTSGFGSLFIYGATYGNGLFVVAGDGGMIATSPDGITWTQRTSGFATLAIGATYGNGLFVVAGDGGVIVTSPDGITWTRRTSSFGAIYIYGVTYGNGLFVAAGGFGKLATSPDGVTWTQRTSGFGSLPIYGVTYGDSLFVAVGFGGKLATAYAKRLGIPSVIDVGTLRCYLRIA